MNDSQKFMKLLNERKEKLNFPIDFSEIVSFTQSLFPIYISKPGARYAIKKITPAQMGKTEFESLTFLYENKIPVPKPYTLLIGGNESYLIMDFIESGNTKNSENFIDGMTKLYSIQSSYWGFTYSNFIGTLEQPNIQTDSFIDYFWKTRWEFQINMGIRKGNLKAIHKQKLENVIQKSSDWGIGKIKPRLIHGDLWSGNVIWAKGGRVYFIDPSLSFGHPEQDLAMAELFGGFPRETFPLILKNSGLDSYQFSERILFWQIYPLLVHVNIFGRSYLGQLESAMNKYL